MRMPCIGSVGEGPPCCVMEGAEHGQKRKKPVGGGVSIDSWAQCLSAYVQECIDCGDAPFPIGIYVHSRTAHAACMQSVRGML